MKTKFLIAAAVAATLSPMAAQAQTRELQRDRQEIREEKGELRDAKRFGDRGDIREERGELRNAKQEYREDRNDWRDDKRGGKHSAHRAPRFDAPFRYRSFNNGASISASYYAPRYTVSNYGAYRLPVPNRNQRYVRHYDDVLLINVRSGKVVRVYRNFF